MTPTAPSVLTVAVAAFVDELVRCGVRHFCVCPGSRSTPLALTIARHPEARLWMHLDERSAAFFGLGMVKATREPVVLVCTSGTAAANFMPAVVEASYARVPLIVLTADRPHELRDCGAPQTIDQIRLYGSHVRWFVDMAEPDATPDLLRSARTVACRAVATARRGPAGPVHINWPFRDPLIPDRLPGGPALDERPHGRPYVEVDGGVRVLPTTAVAALAGELRAARHGVIVCGAQDDPELPAALARLAARLGYPILADPLSGVRCGRHDRTHVLDHYDAFLRDATFVVRHIPEVVLRFGAFPASKPVLQYLQQHSGACRQIVVDGDAGWNEPTGFAAEIVHADGRLLCEAITAVLDVPAAIDHMNMNVPDAGATGCAWFTEWQEAERVTHRTLVTHFESMSELFEGKVFAELAGLLPDGAILYTGNSMPVRDLETFFPGGAHAVRVLANRGANGIDGVISSALGAAAGGAPLVLVIGDLSFYHDSNGLLAAKLHQLNATIVLLNNDGGGIFSFLPQAADPEHFEALFGTPSGLDFQPLAETYGARFRRVSTWEDFRAAVRHGLSAEGLHVVEVPTDRTRNVTLHREIWRAVSAALVPAVVS